MSTMEYATLRKGRLVVKESSFDLVDVKGQPGARRALEIAAAGGHHLLMIGPPGGGKTMLARRIPSILPPMTHAEAIEVTAVHSVAGVLPSNSGLISIRPFRAPHHTVSDAGLVGGGEPPRPGEISLAHRGVLFLDELAEFRKSAIKALQQPLKDGSVTIARARIRATFPALPLLLVAAVNPCPCGYAGDPSHRCQCGEHRIHAYLSRMSGPLLDRIDLHVLVPAVESHCIRETERGESSEQVRYRVLRAREAQTERQRTGLVKASTNARLSPLELDTVAVPDARGIDLLMKAVDSAFEYAKVLRLARTIADLEGSNTVRMEHVAQAIPFRAIAKWRASKPSLFTKS